MFINYISNVLSIIFFTFLGLCISYFLKAKGIKNNKYVCMILPLITGVMCLLTKKSSSEYIQIMTILLALIFCAFYDYQSHIIPDYIHIFIILSAFISINYSRIYENLLSLVLTFSCFFVLEKVTKGKAIFGGGDTKLLSTLAFCFKAKIIPIIAFSCIFVLISYLINLKKKKQLSYAFAPYILGAFFVSTIL